MMGSGVFVRVFRKLIGHKGLDIGEVVLGEDGKTLCQRMYSRRQALGILAGHKIFGSSTKGRSDSCALIYARQYAASNPATERIRSNTDFSSYPFLSGALSRECFAYSVPEVGHAFIIGYLLAVWPIL